ncbi:hypothetical protein R4369_43715 [Rhodococcus opacus]|nr:hypothetical protein [Rhodococcus opacus]MDV7090993.1 hypothetical protein [Rhodococcus opacus]
MGPHLRLCLDNTNHSRPTGLQRLTTPTKIHALPRRAGYWRDIARPRSNFADEKIIDALLGTSIFGADTAQRITGTTDASAYRALGRLTAAGVLEVLSESKRNQIWAATGVLAELDALTGEGDTRGVREGAADFTGRYRGPAVGVLCCLPAVMVWQHCCAGEGGVSARVVHLVRVGSVAGGVCADRRVVAWVFPRGGSVLHCGLNLPASRVVEAVEGGVDAGAGLD